MKWTFEMSEEDVKLLKEGVAPQGILAKVTKGEPAKNVLEEIKAEIVEMRSRQNVGVLECLDVIDKYKAESEVEE